MNISKKSIVVSLAAILSTSTSYAQVVIVQGQTDPSNPNPIVNNGDVTNSANVNTGVIDGNALGTAASISSTGVIANVSISTTNGAFSAISSTDNSFAFPLDGISSLTQNVQNGQPLGMATVNNNINGFSVGANSSLGDGSSISGSATGAVASLSVSTIETDGIKTVPFGLSNQLAKNYAEVNNTVKKNSLDFNSVKLDGRGSSVSLGATGTAAAISVNAIKTNQNGQELTVNLGDSDVLTFDQISSTAFNEGTVNNDVSKADVTVGRLKGAGSSVSVSATGASTSTSINANKSGAITIAALDPSATYRITHTANNTKNVTNNLRSLTVGNMTGNGSSASVSSVGASSSQGFSSIGSGSLLLPEIYSNQRVSNVGSIESEISNTVGDVTAGNISGTNASLSMLAIGASSNSSFSLVNSGSFGSESAVLGSGNNSINSRTAIENKVGDVEAGNISGDRASLSASAIGVTASFNLQMIGSVDARLSSNTILQFESSLFESFSNNGAVSNDVKSISTGGISGSGASVSTSAIGTNRSVNYNSTASGEFFVTNIIVRQDASNQGPTVDNKIGTIDVDGDISSDLASVSASAVGSSASFSAVNNGSEQMTLIAAPVVIDGGITQNVQNGSALTIPSNITNTVTSITTGDLSGIGASVSASAVGASASTSFQAKDGVIVAGLGNVLQTVSNFGTISNNAGTISVGGLSGNGASVSASATGASASLSFSSIR